MKIEQQIGTFRGYDVIIRRETGSFHQEECQKDFENTATYLKEKVFDRIDRNLQEDLEDLLASKIILQKIQNIIIDEWQRYNEKHNPVEEEE